MGQLHDLQRNLQGDVVALYDENGTRKVEYAYDAWGNCTIAGDTTNDALAHANPIRYRGYYYDDDTGLYYLNARYYSPKWRRFISPDSTSYLATESVNGLNLYCYCGNNPVNYCDPSGQAFLAHLLKALVSGLVSAGADAFGQMIFGGKALWEIDFGKIAIAGASGFVAGLIPGSGFASVAGRAIVSSGAENGLRAAFMGETFDIDSVVIKAVVSLVAEYAIKGISKYTQKFTSKRFHKAPNYSQYQHYFRKQGFNYSREDVYIHMNRHMNYKAYADGIINGFLDFTFSFLTYPV